MSRLHSMELADTLAAERARWGKPQPAPVTVDRADPRWLRIRGALCEHHGFGKHTSLDEYADQIWSAVSNRTAPAADPGRTLRGRGQEGA